MKPYGVELIEHPDVADIQAMGCKSCVGRLVERSGEFKSYIRNTARKASTRRRWARKARAAARSEILAILQEND